MELAVFFNAGDFVWKIAIAYNFYTTQKKKIFGIHEEYSEWYSYQNVITNADEVQRFHKKNEMKHKFVLYVRLHLKTSIILIASGVVIL